MTKPLSEVIFWTTKAFLRFFSELGLREIPSPQVDLLYMANKCVENTGYVVVGCLGWKTISCGTLSEGKHHNHNTWGTVCTSD